MQLCDDSALSDPVAAARMSYKSITSYQVTLRSKGHRFFEEIRYFYKSGMIKMEFIKPFPGMILIYNPARKEVRLKPLKVAGHVISFSPDNPMIRSSAGHRVDESDIGSLLDAVAMLKANGETCVSGTQYLPPGRDTLQVKITGSRSFSFRGVHQYNLWLDRETCLPLRVVSYDLKGELIEDLLLDDLRTDPDLPDDLFRL